MCQKIQWVVRRWTTWTVQSPRTQIFLSEKRHLSTLSPSVMIWNKKLPYKNRTQLCWLHPQPSTGIYIYIESGRSLKKQKMINAFKTFRTQSPALIFSMPLPPPPSGLGRKAFGVRFKQTTTLRSSESDSGHNMDKPEPNPTEKTR